jgi:penicillin-binding protein 1B
VGFDDSKDLNLEGAKSALPIWTEFMKRAHQHREYRNVQGWDAPDGIVTVDVDPASGQLATAGCPNAYSEVFVSGTQPVELCRLHGGGGTQVAGWETAPATTPPGVRVPPPAAPSSTDGQYRAQGPGAAAPGVNGDGKKVEVQSPVPAKEEKRGFFGKIRDIFR